jgi:hypothetical protein
MPPVSSSGIRSVRRTLAETCVVAAAVSTAAIPRIAAGALLGRVASSPKKLSPGATVSRFVPSRSRRSSKFVFEDCEMPSTATIEAIPIAMPSAESAARRRRVRSPIEASRTRSRGSSRLFTVRSPRLRPSA